MGSKSAYIAPPDTFINYRGQKINKTGFAIDIARTYAKMLLLLCGNNHITYLNLTILL